MDYQKEKLQQIHDLFKPLEQKPWDDVNVIEAIKNDKSGLLSRAYKCSLGFHDKTFRHDGSKGVKHPNKLFKMAVYYEIKDINTLVALWLHDTIEDNDEKLKYDIEMNYPAEVYFIVIGVTRLPKMSDEEHFDFVSKSNERILVKLIDRLHNLRNMVKNLCRNKKFSKKRLKKYIRETEQYVLPLYDNLSPQYEYILTAEKIIQGISQALTIGKEALKIRKEYMVAHQRSRFIQKLFY